MSTNIFDLVIILLLAFSAYRGYSKGIIASAASLAALLLGVWGAIKFSSLMAGWLKTFIHTDEKIITWIAFAGVFIIVVIGVNLIAKALEGIAEMSALGFVNKVFGAAFSVLKTAFIVSILLVILNTLNWNFNFFSPQLKHDSLFYNPISKFAPSVFNSLNFDGLKQKVEQKTGKTIDI